MRPASNRQSCIRATVRCAVPRNRCRAAVARQRRSPGISASSKPFSRRSAAACCRRRLSDSRRALCRRKSLRRNLRPRSAPLRRRCPSRGQPMRRLLQTRRHQPQLHLRRRWKANRTRARCRIKARALSDVSGHYLSVEECPLSPQGRHDQALRAREMPSSSSRRTTL